MRESRVRLFTHVNAVRNAMSLAVTTSNPRPASLETSARTELTESLATHVGTALSSIASTTGEGVSATVSFSGKALHALESAGEAVVDGVEAGATHALHAVEDLAEGAWNTVKTAAVGAEHLAEAGWDELKTGLKATGDAASSVATSAVFVAGAGGKSLLALV